MENSSGLTDHSITDNLIIILFEGPEYINGQMEEYIKGHGR